MLELKVGVARTMMVFMEDVDDPKYGKTGVTGATIVYCANAGKVTTMVDTSSWAEKHSMGMQGWYSFDFTSGELATAGIFTFHIQATSCFDFPGMVLLVDHDIGDVHTDTQQIIVDLGAVQVAIQVDIGTLSTLMGTAQGADHAADLLKLINEAYGKYVWNFETDPWEIKVYAEDNSTLLAEFTYERDPNKTEQRVRV